MLGRRTWPASLAEKRRARRADSIHEQSSALLSVEQNLIKIVLSLSGKATHYNAKS